MYARHAAEASVMPSATCFALIRKSEGLRLKAYRDAAAS
jgi:GH24 family phage-related lysozyme (muramidase)